VIGLRDFAHCGNLALAPISAAPRNLPIPRRKSSPEKAGYLVNALDFSGRYRSVPLSSWPMATLGPWSYSLYPWQQPFYKFVHDQGSAPVTMRPVHSFAHCSVTTSQNAQYANG
jgi:peptidoglycan/LPS O-acetylase OafA/YrhL